MTQIFSEGMTITYGNLMVGEKTRPLDPSTNQVEDLKNLTENKTIHYINIAFKFSNTLGRPNLRQFDYTCTWVCRLGQKLSWKCHFFSVLMIKSDIPIITFFVRHFVFMINSDIPTITFFVRHFVFVRGIF